MPYHVQRVDGLYSNPEKNNETEIEDYLNDREADGWSLAGIIPDHRTWDENIEFDGFVGSMLVMHKPAKAKRPEALSVSE